MVKLILLRPYGMLAEGALMDVTAGVAEQLINRKIARKATDKEEKKGKGSK